MKNERQQVYYPVYGHGCADGLRLQWIQYDCAVYRWARDPANLHLTTGEEIDPASAPVTTKFVKDTAKAFAEEILADAEAAPDLNEFLSRFTCAACGKRCLLAAPRCSVGNGSKGKATEIYQEMYPDVELFYIGEDIYSLL